MTALRKIWEGWKKVGRTIGDLLARVVLTLLYFTLVLPFGLISALFRDPLDLKPRAAGWRSREPIEGSLDEAGKLS